MRVFHIYILLIFVYYCENQSDKLQQTNIDGLHFWITSPTNQIIIEARIADGWDLLLQREPIFVYKNNAKARVMPFPTPKQIPNGFKKYPNGKWYKYHNTSMTWSQAKLKCQMDGESFLAIPYNDNDLAILRTIIKYKYERVWVGVSDSRREGLYEDIFGNENFWWKEKTKKGYDGPFDCGVIYPLSSQEEKDQVTQTVCKINLHFICEFGLN